MVQSAFLLPVNRRVVVLSAEKVLLYAFVRKSTDRKNKIWSKVIYLKKIFLNIKKLVVKYSRFG